MGKHFQAPLSARARILPPCMPVGDEAPSPCLRIQILGDPVGARLQRDVEVGGDVDVVVATGGLTDSAVATVALLREVFPPPLPIVLVLAPREFSGADRDLALRRARRSAALRGVTLLENGEAVIAGTRFVGATLWTNFRLHGSDAAMVAAAQDAAGPSLEALDIRRNDRRLTPQASTGLHWWSRTWLGLTLPGGMPTIVVTHHAPSGAGLPCSLFMDPLAASRASRCDDLVRQSGASHWIHGGPDAVDHVVGGTRVLSRPLGAGRPAIVSVGTDAGEKPDLRAHPPLVREDRCRPRQAGAVAIHGQPAQASLFDVDEDRGTGARAARAGTVPPTRRRARPRRTASLPDAEHAARTLDAHGDYRVLRRLTPRPVDPDHRLGPGESVALLVDVETTGLDHRAHEVIEIGMVAFVHDAEGRIGPVVGVLGMLQEPKGEIPAEITRLTGITAGMVAGQAIDVAAVRALVERAGLVIAHNAKFDRAFCERLDDAFRHKPWACSVAEVPWREIGFEGAKLGYLVNGCGLFHDGHRAVDDCHALLEVLGHEVGGVSALSHLLRSSSRTRARVWAEKAPFDRKDVLKGRGYRWNDGGDGRPKAWWTEVDEADLPAELAFLEREVHLRGAGLRRDVLTARERHRPV